MLKQFSTRHTCAPDCILFYSSNYINGSSQALVCILSWSTEGTVSFIRQISNYFAKWYYKALPNVENVMFLYVNGEARMQCSSVMVVLNHFSPSNLCKILQHLENWCYFYIQNCIDNSLIVDSNVSFTWSMTPRSEKRCFYFGMLKPLQNLYQVNWRPVCIISNVHFWCQNEQCSITHTLVYNECYPHPHDAYG